MAIRRTRKRRLSFAPEQLVERALKFATDDEQDRTHEMFLSQQRYAKFRQWRSAGVSRPGDGASDAAVADMMTVSLRMQDTLYNAVVSTRPAITSKAVHEKDVEKQDTVDQVLDYQAFVENGEVWLADTVEAFVNDGHFTHFIPWVDEKRKVSEAMRAQPIPESEVPGLYFVMLLQQQFGAEAQIEFRGDRLEEAWDFTVAVQGEPAPLAVAFYTEPDGVVEMVVTREVTRFNGPKIIVKERSEVLHPAGVANLQIPGPSNPGGAPHVLLWDQPTLDEVVRLQKSGRYDELSAKDVEEMLKGDKATEAAPEKGQRQAIQGEVPEPAASQPPEAHRRVTRYMVFDILAVGEDGTTEDVIYCVIKEHKKLLRVRRLAEEYPGTVPRPPFGEGCFIPVRGSRTGISLLEIAEGLHDLRKEITDQMVNLGAITLTPWFFYRPTSSMREEIIRLYPGEGYPLSDPKNDVNFPSVPATGLAYGFNMLSLLEQQGEKVTM